MAYTHTWWAAAAWAWAAAAGSCIGTPARDTLQPCEREAFEIPAKAISRLTKGPKLEQEALKLELEALGSTHKKPIIVPTRACQDRREVSR